jgi:hypothetical protein
LDEALRCNPEGRGFDSRWSHSNFSLTQNFLPHYRSEIASACIRNDNQEYLLGKKAIEAKG